MTLGMRMTGRRRLAMSCAAAVLALSTTAATGAGAAPKRRPALDVYFLIDTTGDMWEHQLAVPELVNSVTRRLAQRTTLRHGYALFRDFTIDAHVLRPVYDQLSPVRAGGGRLANTFTYGGGGDLPEAHTLAMDGALGIAHEPWTMDPPAAGFAPASRKIVVLVTNAPVRQSTGYPTIAEAAARMREAGVAVVAVHILNGSDIAAIQARHDLREIATLTGATTPRAVDCHGDRKTDLRRGDPLVCDYVGGMSTDLSRFADALVDRFG